MDIRYVSLNVLLMLVGCMLAGRVSALDISSAALSLSAGQSSVVSIDERRGKVTVKSSNASIASAKYGDERVNIKARKAGNATITVKDGNGAQSIAVTVSAAPVLTISPSELEIGVGDTATINVANPNGKVSVKSSKAAVASAVYGNAVVTVKGLKTGDTTVTVKDAKSNKKAKIKVVSRSSSSLSVSPGNISLNVGATANITVGNASGNVSAVTGDASVAGVSYSNGIAVVTGVKAGATTITIRDSKTEKSVAVTVLNATVSGEYSLMAWNDLGMHCMDGTDFSVFSILPPYNTLHAQLKNKSGKLVSTNVTLTYQAVADTSGSINTSSADKTNFWSWVDDLFGLSPAENVGVNLDGLASGTPMAGNKTPSLTPAPMTYNAAYAWFEAEGIPVTPFDDAGNKNFYPTVKVVAKDTASGTILATTTTTLPVSDEMTCKGCHASTDANDPARSNAKPAGGWVFDNDAEKDWKRNILKLHDDRHKAGAAFQAAAASVGYSANGLLPQVDDNHKPVLCVACHASNAYFDKENKVSVMGGIAGIAPFTQALHLKHAGDSVLDPISQTPLNSIANRESCYQCHPGSKTQCLRGAMGKAVDSSGNSLMSCQSCHGDLKAVGSSARQGWFEEPTCESCHNSAATGRRATTGVDANGKVIVPADHTFATNANTPVPGLNLYRFSKGHGGLQCEACHGATHAEYPSSHADENLQSIALQGHAGPIAECSACHTTVPNTVNGGPHGMHTTGNAWVNQHEDAGKSGCSYCHGTTSAGTPLSEVKVAKTINAGEFGTKSWPAGYRVSCYSCHNGPNP
ncbi:hypothetical protein [Methylomonas sp. UP202]|uniref:hypothetical protein n=1 Tax=Methylomonas sp. UP202 TaxID=3040943 RepID=UPI002479B171|nr:hypothetical protein [Methylomonas sp. UP202]WGS88258.1 hypothetical protein QC632_10960 [Methylomonas sp. UP202]